nr:hypothetical protein GCM10020092_081800 [Actinoplanes digitatis]
MVRWLRAAVVPVALVVLIGLSGVVLGRIYADALLMQAVAGAALGSVGVGVAARSAAVVDGRAAVGAAAG